MAYATARVSSSVASALLLAGVMAGAWWWRAAIFQTKRVEIRDDGGERVKDVYPIAADVPAVPALPTETVEAVVRANPFSPQRRLKPPAPDTGTGGGSGGAPTPPAPKFVFKGRIDLANRRRAIVEETTTHKTHFLEVGQEVAGFKVLDISENRVVLSDVRTREEVVVSLATPARR